MNKSLQIDTKRTIITIVLSILEILISFKKLFVLVFYDKSLSFIRYIIPK